MFLENGGKRKERAPEWNGPMVCQKEIRRKKVERKHEMEFQRFSKHQIGDWSEYVVQLWMQAHRLSRVSRRATTGGNGRNLCDRARCSTHFRTRKTLHVPKAGAMLLLRWGADANCPVRQRTGCRNQQNWIRKISIWDAIWCAAVRTPWMLVRPRFLSRRWFHQFFYE